MFYAKGIESTGIKPYYVYLYRDGRDVALSFQKAIVGEKHIYALAQNWKKDQEEALKLKEACEPERFYMLNYESLIADPEAEMRKLCDFLHVPYTDKIMEYYTSRESKNTAVAGKMWSNVTKPILKNNSKKFMNEFSSEDIRIFESVAGDVLTKLGYELVTPTDKLISCFSEEEVTHFSELNVQMKKAFRQKMDPADLEKRRKQEELLNRIKQYTSY